MTSTETVERLLEAFNERRWEEFVSYYTAGARIRYPQSGERLAGPSAILGMVRAFPEAPTFTLRELDADGDLVVAHVDADYGSGELWRGAFVYRFEGDLVASETAYFAAPFPAAEWRAPFVS